MRETRHKRRLAVTLGALAALVASAASVGQEGETVYKCIHSDGRIVYSGQPCASSAADGRDGRMEVQTITAPPPGRGGEAAREGIKRIADEYDRRREAERQAREEAERRALERRLSDPEVVVVAPWGGQRGDIPYYPWVTYSGPYDRYRDPAHGGRHPDGDGFSFRHDSGHPHPDHRPPRHRPSRDDRPPRDPYSTDGRPIREPGYSGRYPGGFPGLR